MLRLPVFNDLGTLNTEENLITTFYFTKNKDYVLQKNL